MAKPKPTIAGLTRELGETQSTLGDTRSKLRDALTAERCAREQGEKDAAAAIERENDLRDTVLRLSIENARLRGYIDRIEDETPPPRPMRYGRDAELVERNRGMGRDTDHFARMGLSGTMRRAWHHR